MQTMSVCEYAFAHYTAKVWFAIWSIAANDIRDRPKHIQKRLGVLVVLKLLVRGLSARGSQPSPNQSAEGHGLGLDLSGSQQRRQWQKVPPIRWGLGEQN